VARGSHTAQRGITNVAFCDYGKSWTSWWRSPTGKSYEQDSVTALPYGSPPVCIADVSPLAELRLFAPILRARR
jgi:hypothetical protein